MILLLVVTVFVGFVAEWLVDSINEVTETGHISTTWVGLILLPIVGNAAEHVSCLLVCISRPYAGQGYGGYGGL